MLKVLEVTAQRRRERILFPIMASSLISIMEMCHSFTILWEYPPGVAVEWG